MDRKYDTYVPSALPSASLGRRKTAPAFDDDGDELDKAYAAWNTRIDKEVRAVVEGLGDVVRLADITPASGAHTLPALHMKLRTSALIRAVQQLRDTAHELSLALALGDDVAAAARRDEEVARLRRDIEGLRREIAAEVAGTPPGPVLALDADSTAKAGATQNAKPSVESKDGSATTAPAATAPTVAAQPSAPVPDAMDVDDDDEGDFEEV